MELGGDQAVAGLDLGGWAMSAAMKVVREGGLTFEVSDDEPRVRDIDLAERAGLAKPRDIRATIEANREELESLGELTMRRCWRRIEKRGAVRGFEQREESEYLLNEHQTATVLILLRTKTAKRFRGEVVRTFIAVRKGLLAQPPSPAVLDGTVANSCRIGDTDEGKRRLRRAVAVLRMVRGYSFQRIHGYLRKQFRVSSPFAISAHLLPFVESTLEALERGDVTLSGARRLLPASSKQLAWRWS